MFSVIMPMDPDDNRLALFANTKRAYDAQPYTKEFLIPTRHSDEVNAYLDDHDLWADTEVFSYTTPPNQFNPAMAFNLAVRYASYPSIIITCPEVRPAPDVLARLAPKIGRNVVCQVYNLDQDGNRIMSLVNSQYRSATPGFYFLAMFNRSDIATINGWDERFMAGHSHEDEDFGNRWVRAGLPFEVDDDIVAEHQWHPPHGELVEGANAINEGFLADNNARGVTRCEYGLVS